MKLETFAKRHNCNITDWFDMDNEEHKRMAKEGWLMLALWVGEEDSEPVAILVKSPNWPNYQWRNIWGDIASGTMLTEKELKGIIKALGKSFN